MKCDFQNVTDMLFRNMASSTAIYYKNLLNLLFGSYLAETHLYEFDRPTVTRLHNGEIRISPKMSEFYLDADRKILCGDIKEILQYIFDKPNTYKELYELIQFDDTLSVSIRRDTLGRLSNEFIDDNSLVNLIYEAVYIAVTRQYTKSDDGYIAVYYSNPLAPVNDALFANSEYVAPCRHFCGRDDELDKLHSLVQNNSTVIITGVAGIGKSELVRAYVKKHQKEYPYFGYYFFNDSLKDIIANVIRDPIESNLNIRYQQNLELLSNLGENVLLVIDNYNTSPDDDECFDDLCDLKCKVIFTSHMRFEDYVTYELQAFRHVDDIKTLTKYFYQYKESEWKYLLQIYGNFGFHTFCIELCAKAFSKGAFTPKSLCKNLRSFKIKDFAEKLSAKKDKHPKKKTYFDHLRDLFSLLGLPERHKQVLRIMVFAPYFGFRKEFFAKIMNLKNMVIVEKLIDVGLLYENYWGRINIQSVVAEVVRSELETNNENCSDFLEIIRALCLNESNVIEVDDRTIFHMVSLVFRLMDFKDTDFQFRFIHDCYKFTERFGESSLNEDMIAFEKDNHRCEPHFETLYLSDAASYEMMKGNQNKALEFQQKAVDRSKVCDDIMLQANTLSTYGYYLNLADRKDEALKAMQLGLSLFNQFNGDGNFYFDKYRAIINYADLLFSLGHTDEAISQVSATEKSLKEMDLQDTEVYANCVYSLGLYHLCLNDKSAGNELVQAFRIFVNLYGKQSDFVQTRATELQGYLENTHNDITENEPLKQLLGE
ncbi:MAG: hypothetical protein NC093_09340 [Alistipes sp.]|nr:hypothetical protein [Alistipes sp.]